MESCLLLILGNLRVQKVDSDPLHYLPVFLQLPIQSCDVVPPRQEA